MSVMKKNWVLLWLAAVVLVAGLSSCRREAKAVASSAVAPVLKAEVIRGPLQFRVLVDKASLDLRETLRLTLQGVAPENYTFKFPRFGEGLEPFAITDYQTESPRLDDQGNLHYARTYVLEPFLSDTYTIPPLTGTFTETGAAGKEHALESEAFAIEVKLPPEEFWNGLDIDLLSGLDPARRLYPRRVRWQLLAAAGTVVAMLLAGVIWWVRRRRRRTSLMPVVPPHVQAYAALEQLLADNLLAGRDYKTFYLRLSAILRLYIEGRFQVCAPELTTEEFLQELAGGRSETLASHRPTLQEFLVHCDLVKFAEVIPQDIEIRQSFDLCKHFIRATEPIVAKKGPAGQSASERKRSA